jgi:hypothetical protein
MKFSPLHIFWTLFAFAAHCLQQLVGDNYQANSEKSDHRCQSIREKEIGVNIHLFHPFPCFVAGAPILSAKMSWLMHLLPSADHCIFGLITYSQQPGKILSGRHPLMFCS